MSEHEISDVTGTAYMRIDRFLQMYQHCKEEADLHEVIGLLIGDRFMDSSGPYIYIFDSISGSYTGDIAHVNFTKAGIVEVTDRLEEFKDKEQGCPIDDAELYDRECLKCGYNIHETKMVGWYHSHPGHTAFMSSTDLDTQRKYNFDISVVIDPLKADVKTWQSHEGELQEVILHGTGDQGVIQGSLVQLRDSKSSSAHWATFGIAAAFTAVAVLFGMRKIRGKQRQ